jgi:hypothetical protein
MNPRIDLAALYDHPSLEAKPNARGNLKRPKAPYCLKLTKRKEVFRWLKTLKFVDPLCDQHKMSSQCRHW